MAIELNYGGSFEVEDLVDYVRRSGRNYIIQGQIACIFADHHKSSSLDYWLRGVSDSPDTMQANNNIVDAIVATGRFIHSDNLVCPDSGRRCQGIVLTETIDANREDLDTINDYSNALNRLIALEGEWVNPDTEDIDTDWEPLPGLKPFEDVKNPPGPPEGSLITIENNDTILTEDCLKQLRDWWDSDEPCDQTVGHCTNNCHFHCYNIPAVHGRKYWNDWRNHRDYNLNNPTTWWCSSVSNAAEHYSWASNSGGTFEQLSAALQKAIRNSNELHVAVACLNILSWGGVRNRGAVSWIVRALIGRNLINDLNDATRALRARSNHPFPQFGAWPAIPMTSATTKLFAAVGLDFSRGYDRPIQDVLILDGRVGAGLGLIARKMGHQNLPQSFQFPWGGSRGNHVRDPSCQHVDFPEFGKITDLQRAEFTRIGAKCIAEVLNMAGPSEEFIEVEKGLFMLGYEVGTMCNAMPRACP